MSKISTGSLLTGMILIIIPRWPRCEATLAAGYEGCEASWVRGAD